MSNWDNFIIAQVGASATLSGLIFVSVSLNLTKILQIQGLTRRAAEALIALGAVFVISTLLLVPGQTLSTIGWETLGIGVIYWGTQTSSQIIYLFKTERQYLLKYWPQRLEIFILTQASTIPFIVSGVVLVQGNSNGLYWLVPGVLFSYLHALLDAWVLLIEINR